MRLVMLSNEPEASAVLPAIAFLEHQVQVLPPQPDSYGALENADVVMVDARTDLLRARPLCQLLATSMDYTVLAVIEEGGAVALTSSWGIADFVIASASPAELAARLRLLESSVVADSNAGPSGSSDESILEVGDIVIDTDAYTVRLHGQTLDLTYKEFELLKYLAANQGRVLTRQALLDAVWGDDYIGGSRTVDVHVRRLRAKLGGEHDHLIGTVRNVGYRLDLDE